MFDGRALGVVEAVEEQLERIARVDIALEVNVEAVDLRQVGQHRQRYAGALRRHIEVVVDGAGSALSTLFELFLYRLRREAAAIVAPGHDLAFGTGVQRDVDEPQAVAGAVEGQRDFLTGHQAARIVDVRQRGDRGVRIAAVGAGAHHDLHQRVAAGDGHGPADVGRRRGGRLHGLGIRWLGRFGF